MDANKMTAVEWLMEQITYDNGYGQRWVSFKEATDLNIYFQKALAIEKEQIMKAVDAGFDDGSNFIEDIKFTNAEQYYNETYNK